MWKLKDQLRCLRCLPRDSDACAASILRGMERGAPCIETAASCVTIEAHMQASRTCRGRSEEKNILIGFVRMSEGRRDIEIEGDKCERDTRTHIHTVQQTGIEARAREPVSPMYSTILASQLDNPSACRGPRCSRQSVLLLVMLGIEEVQARSMQARCTTFGEIACK